MTDHLRHHVRMNGCKGTYVVIKGGGISAKRLGTLRFSGDYVIGASSIRSIEGLEDMLVLRVSVRSRRGVVWEGEQCIIGKHACPLSKYASIESLEPGGYVLDVEPVEVPPNLEAEMCVALAPVKGGLLVSGARPGGLKMSPAPGSTRSCSLMIGEPVRVRSACVQRLWLWFFEPQPLRGRSIIVRFERNGGIVHSINTELLRVGVYSEIVVDVLTQRGGGKIVFLDPADLTHPLFITHTEGCGDAG